MLDMMGVLSGQIRAHANVELVQNGGALISRLSVCTAVQWWHVVSHTASRGVLSRSRWASLVRVFTAHVIFRRSSSFYIARVDLIFDKIDSQFGAFGDCIKANNVLGWEPVIRVFLALLLFSCSFHFLVSVHGMLEFDF